MSSRRRALVQLSLVRLRNFFREPGALFWSFGFPLLLSVALAIAFRNRPAEPVDVAIETSSEAAEPVRAALEKSPEVNVKRMSPEEAQAALRTGKVSLVIVPGAPRTYRFDPTRPESRLARLVVDDVLQRADGRVDVTAVAETRVTEPGSRYIDFLIPGLVGLGLMQGGLWGLGYTLVDMRTRKLIKRLMATPMRKIDFLLSFLVMRGAFLLFELPILLGFGYLAFDVPIRGSLALLTLITILGSLAFGGIGLLVASRADNVQTVSGLINLVSMPMFLASGTFFSSARFPEAVQPVVKILPLTALNDALRAVMLEGAGLRGVLSQLSILVVWAIVSMGVALRIFRFR